MLVNNLCEIKSKAMSRHTGLCSLWCQTLCTANAKMYSVLQIYSTGPEFYYPEEKVVQCMLNKCALAHAEAGPSRAMLWLLARPPCCLACAPVAPGHQVRLLGPALVLAPTSSCPGLKSWARAICPTVGHTCRGMCCCKHIPLHV